MKRTLLVILTVLIVAAVAILLAPIAPSKTPGGPAQSIIGTALPPSPAQPPGHLDAAYLPGPPSSPGGPPLLPEKVVRTNRSESGIQSDKPTYQVSVPSGTFTPSPGIEPALQIILNRSTLTSIHTIVQFDHVLKPEEMEYFNTKGLHPFDYFGKSNENGNTRFVTLSVENATRIAEDPHVLWIGAIAVEDKSLHNFNSENPPGERGPNETVYVSITFFPDITPEEESRLVPLYSISVVSRGSRGIDAYIPPRNISQLLREEYIRKIEPQIRGEPTLNFVRSVTGTSEYQNEIW